MKKISISIRPIVAFIIIASATFSGCTGKSNNAAVADSEITSLQNLVRELTATNATIAKNLATFDTLDYTVFSNQDWARLHESHSNDIKVNWPDGHSTVGIERHISDLKAMFVYAPNTSIRQHPVRFGSGNMTCVTGVMTGTFSAPMPIGVGKFIQPTGRPFVIPMCTVGIWKDGLMIEEYIFWDNQAYMNQIGLSK